MNPFQHGEVFVTDDGAETDLDIGHYERFLDVNLVGTRQRDDRAGLQPGHRQGAPRRVPRRHRPGHPAHHQRDQGAHARRGRRPPDVADAPDIIITEIGGTVGDIESLPFLEAARQVRHDVGRDNVFFLHVSLVPYLAPSGELKTKPTQHSVAALRQVGIQPDGLVLRADREIPDSDQAQDLADVRRRHRRPSPLRRRAEHLRHPQGAARARASTPTSSAASGCGFRDVDWTDWDELLRRVHDPEHDVEIALVGKYIDLPDAYLSVTEAMRAGGFHHDAKVAHPLGRQRRVPDRGRCPEGARRGRRGARARRLRRARHRGQARRADVGAREAGARPSASAWACSAWSSSTPATSPASRTRRSTRVRPRARRTRSSRRWRSRRPSSRVPATSAARCASAPTRRSLTEGRCSRQTYGATRGRRAAPPPLRGQQRLPRRSSRRPACVFSGTSPGRHARGVRRAARATCTRTTSRPRRTPSSCPARTGRTRCSRAWSAPRSTRQRASRLVEVERPAPAETVSAP